MIDSVFSSHMYHAFIGVMKEMEADLFCFVLRDLTCADYYALIAAAGGSQQQAANCSTATNVKRVLLSASNYAVLYGTSTRIGNETIGDYTSFGEVSAWTLLYLHLTCLMKSANK